MVPCCNSLSLPHSGGKDSERFQNTLKLYLESPRARAVRISTAVRMTLAIRDVVKSPAGFDLVLQAAAYVFADGAFGRKRVST